MSNIDFSTYAGTQRATDMAIGGILRAFGYAAELFVSGGAWLVTGQLDQSQGAGR
jgi:hypothetical protein